MHYRSQKKHQGARKVARIETVTGSTATGYYLESPDVTVEWDATAIEWIFISDF